MITVLLTICLANNLAQCKDLVLGPYEAPPNTAMLPMVCQKFGAVEIAKEMERWPKWTVRRWTCKPAGVYQDI
jgi:hypothetical protein